MIVGVRIAVVSVAMVALLAAVGSDRPASAAETASPLVGTWRTSPITQAEAEATLRRHGLSKWIKPFRREGLFPVPGPTTLILNITAREWDLYRKVKGERREEIDYDARYTVTGATVDKIHSTGYTTLGWSIKGRVLTLRWLKTTEPPSNGIPDEVFQRALYMTKKFTRQI